MTIMQSEKVRNKEKAMEVPVPIDVSMEDLIAVEEETIVMIGSSDEDA